MSVQNGAWIPDELKVIISKYSTSKKDYQNVCTSFGLIFNRNHIYGRLWDKSYLSIPRIATTRYWYPSRHYHHAWIHWTESQDSSYSYRVFGPTQILIYSDDDGVYYIWGKKIHVYHRPTEPDLIRGGLMCQKPAYICDNGMKRWIVNNEVHRESGPAVIESDNTMGWYLCDEYHRINKPAEIYANGKEIWRQCGLLHRNDGPAIIHPDGTEEWWQLGKRHNESGPAIIRPDGTEEWWQFGKLHRLDGPAITFADKREEYHIMGHIKY